MAINTLVTGFPGWLGTRLVEVLSSPSHELQKYSSGEERMVKALSLPGLDVPETNAEIVRGDVLDAESLKNALKGVETVFHCVGLIHPHKKVSELFEVNVNGTENMLKAAADAGVRRFIFVSSNSPAGVNKTHDTLMKEGDSERPYMAYGKSKSQAEALVNRYHSEGKLETVILRPCWFYGPGQPARQLRFFNMIKAGNPIMFGNGRNLRSMSYLDNTIQALLLAEKVDKANGRTYWVSDERAYTTNEIYETIAKLLNVQLRPRRLPAISSWICEKVDALVQATGFYSTDFHVAGEMAKSIACDISKAKEELGYRPTVGLEEGMRRSVDFARVHQGFKV
ncbi:MAG: NAD-dependent epimerase/dehydratase family protein [bacterium]|nr:NAD-dependent epimerase/dehydratase family protein [bacterium]